MRWRDKFHFTVGVRAATWVNLPMSSPPCGVLKRVCAFVE
jgi:hypothetical protein